jgi:hypothetical protein
MKNVQKSNCKVLINFNLKLGYSSVFDIEKKIKFIYLIKDFSKHAMQS